MDLRFSKGVDKNNSYLLRYDVMKSAEESTDVSEEHVASIFRVEE
jgi:hypothetical protein